MHGYLNWWAGRPGGRPSREFCSLEMAPGRPAESSALCIQFRSTGRSTGQRAVALWFQARSTGGTTVRNLTVGRSTGRAKLPFPGCQRAKFYGGYKYPTFKLVLNKFFKSKILILSRVKNTSFKRVLEPKRFHLYLFLKGWKN